MSRGETRAIVGNLARQIVANRQSTSSVVLLKAGHKYPPVYLAPGLGSTTMDLSLLAMHLGVDRPIYGLETRGIDGFSDPHERIEDMAQYHFDALTQLQPYGPYFLIGYSLGGLVMLEMALRLMSAGEKIALLAMLDTYPHRRHLKFAPRIHLTSRLIMRRVHSLRPKKSEKTMIKQLVDPELARATLRVKEAQYRALRQYRPPFYDGKVKFVRAAISEYFASDPVPVWSHLVKELEVETIPGRHLEMLTTQSENVASVLTRYLDEVDPPMASRRATG